MDLVWAWMMAKLIDEDSDEIDVLFMLLLLEEWDMQFTQLKTDIKEQMNQSYRDNFNMETDMIQDNLNDIGIGSLPVPLYVDFNKLKNPTFDDSVDKQLAEFNRTMRTTLASGFTSKDSKEILKMSSNVQAKSKTVHGAIVKLMRIYRTEATRLRSRTRLFVLEGLHRMGINVALEWLHIMSNTSRNMVNYKPREDHVAINGQRANSRGYFELPNGNTTKAPGLFGIASEDINCQCTIAFRR